MNFDRQVQTVENLELKKFFCNFANFFVYLFKNYLYFCGVKKSEKKYRTVDILEVISDEVILTYKILQLRFPDVNFDERDDTIHFKNAIAFNKSSVLNEMLFDKKKFDRDIYDILINDDLIDTDNLIKLEIVRNNQK